MEKNYEKFTKTALTEVMKGKGEGTESNEIGNSDTDNIKVTPKDIQNGSLKFDFYYKEGSEDEGAVYFDVNFKKGRNIVRRKDYNLQKATANTAIYIICKIGF